MKKTLAKFEKLRGENPNGFAADRLIPINVQPLPFIQLLFICDLL